MNVELSGPETLKIIKNRYITIMDHLEAIFPTENTKCDEQYYDAILNKMISLKQETDEIFNAFTSKAMVNTKGTV